MDNLGKLPPQALELEKAVLGAILIDKKAINSVVGILKVDSFYQDANQRIFMSILNLWELGDPIDILTVTNRLKTEGNLEMIGGAYYVSKLTSRVNSSANIEYHCTLILQAALKRKMIALGGCILDDAYEDQTDVFELIDSNILKLNQINKEINSIGEKGVQQHSQELKEDIQKAINSQNKILGQSTGLYSVDKKFGGREGGMLLVEAARPGMGKTAKILSEIRHDLDSGKNVAFFSLEMPGKQLIGRMVSQDTEISYYAIKRPWLLSVQDLYKVNKRIEHYENHRRFKLLDKSSINCNFIRSILLDFPADKVYLDYIQLMQDVDKKTRTRDEVVGNISRGLKGISKDFDIPVIALAQLNRSVEARGGFKIPMLSDLRESGSIEQDADMVTFIYRPEYYGFDPDKSGYRANTMLLIVAKNRHGELGRVEVEFKKSTMTIADFEEDDVPEFKKADF